MARSRIGDRHLDRDPLGMSDDPVIASLRCRDHVAWRSLVDDVIRRVNDYARRLGHPDPDDVVGVVLEAVTKVIDRFDGGVTELWTFIFSVAHRRVVDTWRLKARGLHLERLDDSKITVPDESPLLECLHESECLAHLEEDQRTLIVLRYFDDRPTKDIARLLGKSDEAVRAGISRALSALRVAMSDHPMSSDSSPSVSLSARSWLPTS